MILVDTSAWVEYLRDTGSPACIRVGQLLSTDLATCDVVRMELLAGARDDLHQRDLRRLIARAVLIPLQPGDFDQAAGAPSAVSPAGARPFAFSSTVSSARWPSGSIVPVLHCDADFDTLARHTPLRVDTA